MHAVVVMVTMKDPEAATKYLHEAVVPRVKEGPGLVCAYWTRGEDDTGMGMVVFEDENPAKGMGDRLRAMSPDELITLNSVEVREVVANV